MEEGGSASKMAAAIRAGPALTRKLSRSFKIKIKVLVWVYSQSELNELSSSTATEKCGRPKK